jgi:hypothetical protein
LSDKKVTLSIEIPGVLGNAYQFKTLITDTIDKTPGNRMNIYTQDNYNNSPTASDTSNVLSPLRGFNGASNLFRIGPDQFTGFRTVTVKDDQAGSDFAYSEEQGFWVGSAPQAQGVYYEQSADFRQVVARPNNIVYNMRFLGNDYGIPVCTSNLVTSGDWTSCDPAGSDLTSGHRVKIQFLGAEWVISELKPPAVSTNSGTAVTAGGEIKLAKEAKYDIINVGGVIDGGTFKIRLSDISVATGAGNQHPAILDVLDANDAVVGQIQVNPGDTYTYTQTSTGTQIKVHVYRTAPGFTLNAKWAEIAVFTDEITLQDGKRYNNAASNDANWGNVYASLLWKNRDATTNQTNSLREVVLYVDDVNNYLGGEDRMVAGTSLSFPKKDSSYRLTYNGLDLTDADYVALKIQNSNQALQVAAGDCNAQAHNQYNGNFIKVMGGTGSFGGTNDPLGGDNADQFFIDPTGQYANTRPSAVGVSHTIKR